MYLDDTTADNGCLEVVPGSHTAGRHPTRQDSDPFGNLEMDPEANAHMERVPVVVPAGSVVLFGAYLAHATGPNTHRPGPPGAAVQLPARRAGRTPSRPSSCSAGRR